MRQLGSWISAFTDYTEGLRSPELYRRWAAVSTVAAGLQRKVWTYIEEQYQYPNLYVLLVGPPGIGKGNALRAAKSVARPHPEIRIAPDSITQRRFYTEMQKSLTMLNFGDPKLDPYIHHSLSAYIDEFGVFVRRGDIDFMVCLSNIYDSLDHFEHATEHSGEASFDNCWFNWIAGCTPKWVRETFTEEALDQGFPARIILVYSEEQKEVPLFGQRRSMREDLYEKLYADFEEIVELKGEFKWDTDAMQLLEDWVETGMNPKPLDQKLVHYCRRRIVHMTKLSMVMSAAKRSDLIIREEDVEEARQLLLLTERSMPKALKYVGRNIYIDAMETIVKYVELTSRRTKKPVPEHRVRSIIEREVPLQYTDILIDTLVNQRKILAEGHKPDRLFYTGDTNESRADDQARETDAERPQGSRDDAGEAS